jgi:hypothetical protein
MTATTYRTTAEMLEAHPNVMVDAIHYRINRAFEGEGAARAIAGEDRMPLIERWHALQASEARLTVKAKAAADRAPRVHRKAHKASQRTEAASYPVPSFARA